MVGGLLHLRPAFVDISASEMSELPTVGSDHDSFGHVSQIARCSRKRRSRPQAPVSSSGSLDGFMCRLVPRQEIHAAGGRAGYAVSLTDGSWWTLLLSMSE